MKTALRAQDRETLDTLRLLRAAIQRLEVDERIELDDRRVIEVIQKQVKQSTEAATQFTQGQRADLAAKELKSIDILKNYLPAPLSDAEIDTLIDAAIRDTGATSPRDMGKVMARVKNDAAGRADLGAVSARVKRRLTKG